MTACCLTGEAPACGAATVIPGCPAADFRSINGTPEVPVPKSPPPDALAYKGSRIEGYIRPDMVIIDIRESATRSGGGGDRFVEEHDSHPRPKPAMPCTP